MTALSILERRMIDVSSSSPDPQSGPAQALWFAAQARPWLTLALIAPGPTEKVRQLAAALVSVGRLTHGGEVDLLDTQGGKLREVSWHLLAMSQAQTRGAHLVVALDPLGVSPLAMPVLRAADGVILVLELGRSNLAASHQVIEAAGRGRVLGCVVCSAADFP